MILASRWQSRIVLIVLTLLWCGAVTAGFAMLLDYSTAPGPSDEPPANWPSESRIARQNQQPTLIMFAHPKCPCSRASVEELARLMAQCGGQLSAHVLFEKPAGTCCGWTQTGLYDAAQAIPGVQVETDSDGKEAKRFAAKTSGMVLLYSADGRLLFQGGITSSRGHEGDNLGRRAIYDLVTTGKSNIDRTPVFGCLLADPPPSSSVQPAERQVGGEDAKND